MPVSSYSATLDPPEADRLSGRLWGTLLFLAFGILCRAQSPAPELPQTLQIRLRQYRVKDDLSGWIYEQIQWVAKAPAGRSVLLVHVPDEAWRRPRTQEEAQAWLDLLTNEGYFLLLSGAIVPSTDAYTAAYEWAREHQDVVDASSLLENILKPLGNNYTRLGDYEQALFIHEKALAVAREDKEAMAGVYSNLANTSSNMSRPLRALEYCREGLAVADPHSALCGLLLSEQADACQQLRRFAEARGSIDKSIELLERASGREKDRGYWLLMAYQQAGDIYAAEPQKALRYYQKAVALHLRLSEEQGGIRQREQAKLFQRLSALFARLHRDRQALFWSDRCLTVLLPEKSISSLHAGDLYAENTLADLLYTRAGLAKRVDSVDEAIRLFALCFAAEKKLRQALISGSSREAAVADSRPQFEEAIATAWNAWERTKAEKYKAVILELMESSKAQLLLDEMLQQRLSQGAFRNDSLEMRIRLLEKARVYYEKESLRSSAKDSGAAAQEKQIEWELAQLRKKREGQRLRNPAEIGTNKILTNDRFSIDSVGTLFEKGQAGRIFFLGSSVLYTVECTQEGIGFVERKALPEGWGDSLAIFVQTWFQGGANAMIARPLTYYRQAYALYRMIFGTHPFEPGKEYILFPDGALSLLPVEALVTRAKSPLSPADWPFVVRETLISYGWSLQTFSGQRNRDGVAKGFAGFFLKGDQGPSPSLAAVALEEDAIRQAIKNGDWYADSQATTGRFLHALETSAIVHISSHAFIRKNGVDAPHIELYDDPFYLFELHGLADHPGLVVLSACRTGDGRIITGEGVQSLARAFTAGGANAVVAGWWNLNDETAAQLIGKFYAELKADDAGNAAVALRKAKLEWLSDPEVGYLRKLPYFWAALGYSGNPRPLVEGYFAAGHKRQEQGRWWWSLFLLTVIPLIILAYARVRRGRNQV